MTNERKNIVFTIRDVSPQAKSAILEMAKDVNEACGFIIGQQSGNEIVITDCWPVPSAKPSPTSYSIPRSAYTSARARARKERVRILGTVHTHPGADGTDGPSDADWDIAETAPKEALRFVFCVRTRTLYAYAAYESPPEEII